MTKIKIKMYLCTRNYDLKRGGTFETAKAGTSIPLFTEKKDIFPSMQNDELCC